MSDPSDYGDEMIKNRYTERDIDVLFSGSVPNDPELSNLASVVEHLRTHLPIELDESEVEGFIAQATAAAQTAAPTATPPVAPPSNSRRRRPLVPRFAGATALVLLIVTSGLAAASDKAVPGGSLYRVDRAFERVGIGAGGAGERLAEATVLVNRDRVAEALVHAAEAIGEGDDQEASDALTQSAARVGGLSPGNEDAAQVRADVAAMLEWMITTDATGKEFGQGVAERARQIGGETPTSSNKGSGGDQPNSEDNGKGAGPPDDVPPGKNGNEGDTGKGGG